MRIDWSCPPAGFAHATGDRRVDGDQLPNLQSLHAGSQTRYPGGKFMTHDHRIGHHLIADATLQIVVHIRSTHPHRHQSQEHLPRTRLWPEGCFQAHIADFRAGAPLSPSGRPHEPAQLIPDRFSPSQLTFDFRSNHPPLDKAEISPVGSIPLSTVLRFKGGDFKGFTNDGASIFKRTEVSQRPSLHQQVAD